MNLPVFTSCLLLCLFGITRTQIVIPEIVMAEYAASGLEWEDFVELLEMHLAGEQAGGGGGSDSEGEEEQSQGQSSIDANSTIITKLKNGSLGVSFEQLASIEELPLPVTPKPIPFHTLKHTVPAPVTSESTSVTSKPSTNRLANRIFGTTPKPGGLKSRVPPRKPQTKTSYLGRLSVNDSPVSLYRQYLLRFSSVTTPAPIKTKVTLLGSLSTIIGALARSNNTNSTVAASKSNNTFAVPSHNSAPTKPPTTAVPIPSVKVTPSKPKPVSVKGFTNFKIPPIFGAKTPSFPTFSFRNHFARNNPVDWWSSRGRQVNSGRVQEAGQPITTMAPVTTSSKQTAKPITATTPSIVMAQNAAAQNIPLSQSNAQSTSNSTSESSQTKPLAGSSANVVNPTKEAVKSATTSKPSRNLANDVKQQTPITNTTTSSAGTKPATGQGSSPMKPQSIPQRMPSGSRDGRWWLRARSSNPKPRTSQTGSIAGSSGLQIPKGLSALRNTWQGNFNKAAGQSGPSARLASRKPVPVDGTMQLILNSRQKTRQSGFVNKPSIVPQGMAAVERSRQGGPNRALTGSNRVASWLNRRRTQNQGSSVRVAQQSPPNSGTVSVSGPVTFGKVSKPSAPKSGIVSGPITIGGASKPSSSNVPSGTTGPITSPVAAPVRSKPAAGRFRTRTHFPKPKRLGHGKITILGNEPQNAVQVTTKATTTTATTVASAQRVIAVDLTGRSTETTTVPTTTTFNNETTTINVSQTVASIGNMGAEPTGNITNGSSATNLTQSSPNTSASVANETQLSSPSNVSTTEGPSQAAAGITTNSSAHIVVDQASTPIPSIALAAALQQNNSPHHNPEGRLLDMPIGSLSGSSHLSSHLSFGLLFLPLLFLLH